MTASILLRTNNLYESPDFGDFHKLTQAYLSDCFVGYESNSCLEKWTCIMDAFGQLSTIEPNDKDKFNNFKTNRLQVDSNNRYILTMKQSLIYFESFYFLYNDTETDFKLSAKQRVALIKDILAGMSSAVCEPGKFTHFENTLQRLRSDLNNWLLIELGKQRTTLIQTMDYHHLLIG